jgi:hypothetical protein
MNKFLKTKTITQVTCRDLETYNTSLSCMFELSIISIQARGVQLFLPNIPPHNQHTLYSFSSVQNE